MKPRGETNDSTKFSTTKERTQDDRKHEEITSEKQKEQDHEKSSEENSEEAFSSSSTSLPIEVKEQKGLHLVVDLNHYWGNTYDVPPDNPSNTHLNEVMEKNGLSPIKRGRSEQRNEGKRRRNKSIPPSREKKQNKDSNP